MDHDTTQDDRTLALVAYLLAIFAWIIGPLILYLVKKDSSRFVGYHAMQAIALELAAGVIGFAAYIVGIIFGMLGPLALLAIPVFLLAWLVGMAAFVFCVVGAIKAYGGEWYEVPVLGRLVRRQVLGSV